MKVKIDPDLCTVCMLCVDTLPEVFEMGDEVAQVKSPDVPAGLEDQVKDIASQCVADAISVE